MGEKLAQTLAKPLMCGAAGAALSYAVAEGANPVLIAGKILPGWVVVGGTVAVASYAGEIGKNYILPYLQGGSLAQLEGSVLEPALTGVATYGAFYLMDQADSSTFVTQFLLGAGSNVAGDYAYTNWVQKML